MDERLRNIIQRIESGVSIMSEWIRADLDAGCTQDPDTNDTVHQDICACNALLSWSHWQDGWDSYAAAMQDLKEALGGY